MLTTIGTISALGTTLTISTIFTCKYGADSANTTPITIMSGSRIHTHTQLIAIISLACLVAKLKLARPTDHYLY